MSEAIDAHQHFWRLARGDYGWLTPDLGSIYRDFDESDLAPILARHGIENSILVQAAPTEAETEYLLSLARGSRVVAGVVGWTDFEAEDAAERIAARAREPLLKGLRPMLQDLADDAWLLRSDLVPAFRAVREHGLRFDALVKPRHLPILIRFVERHPDLPVVIDHGAKPDIERWNPAGAEFRRWTAQLKTLASLGCYAKLSGLVTEAGIGWTADALRPYVDALLACFGPERLMWGSDWPVVNGGGGYDAWREASLSLTAHLPARERENLFGGTAARFYGIGGPQEES